MKTLGILGSMSWISTLEYSRPLNEGVQKSPGVTHSARILVSSVEFQEMADWMARGDGDSVKGVLPAGCTKRNSGSTSER